MTTALFKNIRPRILYELDKAEVEIKAAIGWFTNHDLFDALCKKVRAGLTVELIVLNDYINNRIDGLDFQYFIDIGGHFYFGNDDSPMHNKSCIIDRKVLINGSYNWTYYAESRNEENTIIHSDNPKLIDDFTENFNRIRNGLPRVEKVIRRDISDIYFFDTKYYLAQDYLYWGIDKKNPSIVDKAVRLLPENTSIQKTAFDSKMRRRRTTKPIIESIKDDRVAVLVPLGTEIPAGGEANFTTVSDDQIKMEVEIKYGNDEKASRNTLIGKFTVAGIPRMKAGEPKVITRWDIDLYGKMIITEIIKDTGEKTVKTYDINDILELLPDENQGAIT